jgi:hypothetical protein
VRNDGETLLTRRERTWLALPVVALIVSAVGLGVALALGSPVATGVVGVAVLLAAGVTVWAVWRSQQAVWQRLDLNDRSSRKRMRLVLKTGRLSGDLRVDDAARRTAREQIRSRPFMLIGAGMLLVGVLLTAAGTMMSARVNRWFLVFALAEAVLLLLVQGSAYRRSKRLLADDIAPP